MSADSHSHPASAPRIPREVAAIIPSWLAEFKVPGLALAMVESYDSYCTAAFGLADTVKSTPLSVENIFPVASLGKPVTACAALKLVAGNALDLDCGITRYLPALSTQEHGNLSGITLRHALSHRSGLPNWRRSGEELRAVRPVGQTFGYSGEAYFLIQQALETVTGASFETLIRNLVLEPCGMNDSAFSWNGSLASRQVTGHDAMARPAHPRPYFRPNAAHTFYSTVGNYALFLRALIGKTGALRKLLKTLLPAETRLAQDLDWGLGFSIGKTERGPCLWHVGNNIHCVSFALLYPDQGSGLVLMSNGTSGLSLCPQVVQAISGGTHPLPEWLDRFFATFESNRRV